MPVQLQDEVRVIGSLPPLRESVKGAALLLAWGVLLFVLLGGVGE